MNDSAIKDFAVFAQQQGASDKNTARFDAKSKAIDGHDSVEALLQGFATPLPTPARSGSDRGFPLDDLDQIGTLRGLKRSREDSLANLRVQNRDDETGSREIHQGANQGGGHRGRGRGGFEARAAMSNPPTPRSMPRVQSATTPLYATDALAKLTNDNRASSRSDPSSCGNGCLKLLMTSFEHVGVMVGRLQHSSLLNSSPQQQQHANPRSHINRDKMVSLDAVLQCTKQALHICTKTLDCNFCPTQQSCVFLIPRLAVQMAVLVDQACRDYKLCFGHRKREYLGHDVDAHVAESGVVQTKLEQPMLLGQYSLDTLSEWLAVMGPVVLLQARGWEALLSRLTGFEDLGREEMVRSAMQSTHRSVTMILQLL